MKLFYPKSHLDLSKRRLTFHLLKAFLKEEGFTNSQRMEVYGVSEEDYEFVEDLTSCDVAVLTMAWDYYVKNGKTAIAIDFINEALAHHKKVLTLNGGDFGVVVPDLKNMLVLRQSGNRSQLPQTHVGMPVFFKDPLLKWYQRNDIIGRPYHSRPVVGFCGQVNGSKINALKEILKVVYRNLKFYMGRSMLMPQPVLSSSYLRYKFLKGLRQSPLVDTHFIFRTKHGAGIDFNRASSPVTKEFFDNIKDSDYILCYRGSGNFSVRFYETLAMGRIPILVDSDCILPFQNLIDWKKHVVWIAPKDRNRIAEKVIAFHKTLNGNSFNELLESNRLLWETKLQMGGFFKNFMHHYLAD